MKVTLRGHKGNATITAEDWQDIEFTILPTQVIIEHSDFDEPFYVKRSELSKLLRLLEMY
jgi:hypothetical protein